MKITINLNSESVDAAIEKIEDYRTKMEEKCREFSRRLALYGAEVARATYDGAAYAGTNDITVHTEMEGNRCKIIANGSTLGFIEFGTGVAYPLGEYAAQAGAPPHGTYGKHLGATGKKWVYKGYPGNLGEPDSKRPGLVWTKGNPPANAFPAAVREMQEEALSIAKEVFRFD